MSTDFQNPFTPATTQAYVPPAPNAGQPFSAGKVQTGGQPAVYDTANVYGVAGNVVPPSFEARKKATWTTTLTCIAIAFALFGLSGIFGGVMTAMSFTNLEENSATMLSQFNGDRTQRVILQRSFDAQIQAKNMLIGMAGFRTLLGFGFLAACALIATKFRKAPTFTCLLCGAALFYNICMVTVGWMCAPSLEGIPNVAEGVAKGYSIGLIFGLAIALLVKIGIYWFFMGYMGSKHVEEIFEGPNPHVMPQVS